jgi:hypothetical protein
MNAICSLNTKWLYRFRKGKHIVTIHFYVLSHDLKKDKTTGSTIAAGSAYTSGPSEFILVFCGHKSDLHDITEILLKVALNPITLTLTLVSAAFDSDIQFVFSIRAYILYFFFVIIP